MGLPVLGVGVVLFAQQNAQDYAGQVEMFAQASLQIARGGHRPVVGKACDNDDGPLPRLDLGNVAQADAAAFFP